MATKPRLTKAQVLRTTKAMRLQPPAHHFPPSVPHEICPQFGLNAEEREALIRLLEYGIEGTTTPIRRASGKTLVLYDSLHKRISEAHESFVRKLIRESNRIWKATKKEREKQATYMKLAEK